MYLLRGKMRPRLISPVALRGQGIHIQRQLSLQLKWTVKKLGHKKYSIYLNFELENIRIEDLKIYFCT